MELIDYIIVFRFIERLLIQIGGFFLIFLGILLFKWGIYDKGDVIFKTKEIKVKILGFAPGVIFAILGSIILALGISRGVTIENSEVGAVLNSQKDIQVIEKKLRIAYEHKTDEVTSFLNDWKAVETTEDHVKNTKKLQVLLGRIRELEKSLSEQKQRERK